jgi:uncharacterized protein (DUF885 family)
MIFRALLALALSASAHAEKFTCADFNKAAASAGSAEKRLQKYLDVNWKYLMNEYPEWATFVGYPGLNAKLSDQSVAAIERRKADTHCMLKALHLIPRARLKGEERVTYDLAERDLKMSIEGERFNDDYMPVNHMNGFQIDFSELLSAMPTATAADYENILARLEALPVAIKQNEELMREGLKRKATPVKAFLPKVAGQLDALASKDMTAGPLFKPFKDFGAGIADADKKRLGEKALSVLESKVYPALAAFKTFLNTEYIPQAREFIALSDMPDGKAWYAYMVKRHTTTNKTPEELHQLGLSEVKRITAQMNKIREQVKFDGDLKAFNRFLMKDKRFYYTNAEDLLAGYRDIAKKTDAQLPKMFHRLPRLTYGVRAIADYAAPSSSGAQYVGGSLEAGRAGWFEANTYDLPSRPKWEMETLAFHESVPGHHFQIAIAQELEGLPEFRKHGGFTAFIEGWALYAESLGDEMGFFKDPYSKYGNLSDEMMRAIRLVVDTGMHAKGWSKHQALDFYRSKMPITDSDSEVEIDRYITWPGQALAYKVGQLKFRELREKSRMALGERFDVRDYHDEVLRHGALPMDVLEKTVDEWIAGAKKQKPKAPAKSKLT